MPVQAIRQVNIFQEQETKKDEQKMCVATQPHTDEQVLLPSKHGQVIVKPPLMEIDLQCQRCAACCRWPGEVRLTDSEVSQLASFLGMHDAEFIEIHTRLRKDRRGLALKSREDHSCIFLDGNSCRVQAVKPQQCKDFPNRWVNLLWGKVPVEVMRRDYPMLFACSAFKEFLKSHNDINT